MSSGSFFVLLAAIGRQRYREECEMADTRRRTYTGTPINPTFGEGRWQDALRRMRARIADGLDFVAWDDTTPGNKDTHCSWGMCSNDVEQWPDADDHTFPDDFEGYQRVAPRDAPGGCPLDRRTGTEDEQRWGCFYRCRVFTKPEIRAGREHVDRPVVVRMFDEVIEAREREHGHKTTEDDDEPWR